MTLQAGTSLGSYEVVSALGAGGMGEVYRARDGKLGREVAIKTLPEEVARDAERLARSEREARLLASLNHPNIAAIYGFEEHEGTRFLVLELVEGPTLADRIAQGPIPVDEAIPIAKQIAEALEAAHEQGIIHRDLKPANVKVREDGTVKVLDFGLAKALEPAGAGSPEASHSPTLTSPAMSQAGFLIGTAAYMSPEQARGKVVDRRADVWAFGVVFLEMVTGRKVFEGEDVSLILASVLKHEPDWAALPKTVPPVLARFLRKCLAKDPKQRVPDIGALRLALEGAFEAEALQPAEEKAAGGRWRRPLTLALLGLAAFAAGALGMWMRSPPPDRRVQRFVVSGSGERAFRPVADNQGLAISPDGTRIAYPAGIGRWLFVRPIDDLEGLLGLGGEISDNPVFSPDGSALAFSAYSDTSWKRVSVLGGAPTTLWGDTRAPRGGSWGPGGDIVFGMNEPGTGLFRGPAAGGEPEALTTPDEAAGEQNHWWPDLLPGGQAVLFTIIRGASDQEKDVALLDLATGDQRVLIPGGTGPRFASSGHIVYGVEGRLQAVPFDLDRLEVTGNPVPVVEDVMIRSSGAVQFALSATGSLVYATGGNALEQQTLVWVDREGKEATMGTEPRAYEEFSLSPDGRRVAVRVRDPEGEDVWVYDVTRGTSTRLTFEPGPEYFPTWTPDGTRVAFSTTTGVAWKAGDGSGGVAPLGGSAGDHPLSFAPDGTQLVLFQRRGRVDIGVLSLEGDRSTTPLLDSEFQERNASLSRDGRWLAYESNESGRFEVYVRPFPDVDAGRWQISTDGGSWPVWSPAGDELFYRGPTGVVAVPYTGEPTFAPGSATELFQWRFPIGSYRRLAVSPDGQRFLLLKDVFADATGDEASEPQIILVQNWFEELKRLVPTD